MRDKTGRFIKGYSGNPGGRPKDEHNVIELARSYTTEALETLVELMRDGKDERVRGTAAQALLDRSMELLTENADYRAALQEVSHLIMKA